MFLIKSVARQCGGSIRRGEEQKRFTFPGKKQHRELEGRQIALTTAMRRLQQQAGRRPEKSHRRDMMRSVS